MPEEQKNTPARPLTHRRIAAALSAPRQEAEPVPDVNQYVPDEYQPEPIPIYPPQAMQSVKPDVAVPEKATVQAVAPKQDAQAVHTEVSAQPAGPIAGAAKPEPAIETSIAEIAPPVATVDSILSREGESYSQLVGLASNGEEGEALSKSEACAQEEGEASQEATPIPCVAGDAGEAQAEPAKAEEIPHMNTAPPYHAAPVSAGTEAIQPASEPTPIAHSFTPEVEEDDFGDTDSTRFTPVSIQPMPVPVPVPTAPIVPEVKRHSGFVLFFLTLTLLVSLGMAYFSGIADDVLAQLGIPAWKQVFAGIDSAANSVPDIFSTGTLQPGSDTSPGDDARGEAVPAMAATKQALLSRLKAFAVTPSATAAPASLIFSIYSSKDVTNIKLAKDNGEILFAEGRGAPSGDGILWQFTVAFDEPYEGLIYAFLRDSDSNWASSGDSIHVRVQ